MFDRAARGEITLYTTSLVVAELLYVASRLYRAMNIQEPNQRVHEYIVWLQHYVGLKVLSIDSKLALEIGELKKKLKIALTDCSIIACSRLTNAIPLFRRIEKEMIPVLNELRRLGVVFLEEIE